MNLGPLIAYKTQTPAKTSMSREFMHFDVFLAFLGCFRCFRGVLTSFELEFDDFCSFAANPCLDLRMTGSASFCLGLALGGCRLLSALITRKGVVLGFYSGLLGMLSATYSGLTRTHVLHHGG